MYKDGPRAERVKETYILYIDKCIIIMSDNNSWSIILSMFARHNREAQINI